MLDIPFYNSGYLVYGSDKDKYNYTYAVNTTDYPTPHSHMDFWEFCIVYEGRLKNCIVDGEEEYFPSGTLSFMTTGDKHYTLKASPTLKYINIPVRQSHLKRLLEAVSPVFEEKLIRGKRCFNVSDSFAYEVEKLVRRCNMLGPEENDKKDGLLCSAVLMILQELNKIHLNVSDGEIPFLKKLSAITDREESVRYSVLDLEREMSYSSAHLNRLFKEHTGVSPREYLMKHKFRYAMNLLRNTDAPVREIAYEIGYSNLSHFFANFKKIYGVTPSECRGAARKLK